MLENEIAELRARIDRIDKSLERMGAMELIREREALTAGVKAMQQVVGRPIVSHIDPDDVERIIEMQEEHPVREMFRETGQAFSSEGQTKLDELESAREEGGFKPGRHTAKALDEERRVVPGKSSTRGGAREPAAEDDLSQPGRPREERLTPTTKDGSERIRSGAFRRVPRATTERMVLEMLHDAYDKNRHGGWVTAHLLAQKVAKANTGEAFRYWGHSIAGSLRDMMLEGLVVRDSNLGDVPGRNMHKYRLSDTGLERAMATFQQHEGETSATKQVQDATKKAQRAQDRADNPPAPSKPRPLKDRNIPEEELMAVRAWVTDHDEGTDVYQQDAITATGVPKFNISIAFAKLVEQGLLRRGDQKAPGVPIPFRVLRDPNTRLRVGEGPIT